MKPLYLLDTNIISEVFKLEPNKQVLELFQQRMNLCAICSVSQQELVYGMARLPEGNRKEVIRQILEKIFFNMEIIPYDSFAAKICGELLANCEREREPRPYSDTQIASIAIANNMILVTHNIGDFSSLAKISMLQVEDWWE